MELVSKTKTEVFKHNGVEYTRTSDTDDSYSWSSENKARKTIMAGGFIHHKIPKKVHHPRSDQELEKLYTQYMRELKLERILKKNTNWVLKDK